LGLEDTVRKERTEKRFSSYQSTAAYFLLLHSKYNFITVRDALLFVYAREETAVNWEVRSFLRRSAEWLIGCVGESPPPFGNPLHGGSLEVKGDPASLAGVRARTVYSLSAVAGTPDSGNTRVQLQNAGMILVNENLDKAKLAGTSQVVSTNTGLRCLTSSGSRKLQPRPTVAAPSAPSGGVTSKRALTSVTRNAVDAVRSNKSFKSKPSLNVAVDPFHAAGLPSILTSEDFTHVARCLSVIARTFILYGCPADKVALSFQKTLPHWEMLSTELGANGWIKAVKYKIAAFFSHWKGQDIPARPKADSPAWTSEGQPAASGFLLGGAAGRWVKVFMFRSRKDSADGKSYVNPFSSFLQTILNGDKKGMPRADKATLKLEALATARELTRARPEGASFPVADVTSGVVSHEWGISNELYSVAEERREDEKTPDYLRTVVDRHVLTRQLRRTVREVFKGKKMTDEEWNSPQFPSVNANYNRGRDELGGVGEVTRYIQELGARTSKPLLDIGRPWDFTTSRTYDGIGLHEDIILTKPSVHVDIDGYSIYDVGALPERFPVKSLDFFKIAIPVQTVRPMFTPFDWESRGSDNPLPVIVDSDVLRQRHKAVMNEMKWSALDERPLVETVPLPEALKIRVISKGPSLTYYYLKPLQKKMWSIISKHPCFSLTGKPISAEEVEKRMGKKLPEGFSYLSGDYKSATDNFPPWVSEVLANAVSDELGLDEQQRELFIRSLTRHEILQPDLFDEAWKEVKPLAEELFQSKVDRGDRFVDDRGNPIDPEDSEAIEAFGKMEVRKVKWLLKQSPALCKPQRWGQLMGSVTSFPILCLANAAYCRYAIEIGLGAAVPLDKACLMINGDDVLMKTTDAGRLAWKTITKAGGLTESVGKTYWSDEFCIMNSTMYERLSRPTFVCPISEPDHYLGLAPPPPPKASNFQEVPFINFGILLGVKRSGGKVGLDAVACTDSTEARSFSSEDGTLGARARELVAKTPSWLRVPVFRIFMEIHRELLKSTSIPWFMPEWLGGVGLPSLATEAIGEESLFASGWQPSPRDLCIGQQMLFDWKKADAKRPRKPVAANVWVIRQLTEGLIGQRGNVMEYTDTMRIQDEKMNALLSVSLLYGDYRLTTADPIVDVLRHNEKVWRYYEKRPVTTTPLSPSRFTREEPQPIRDVTHL
jgi:hypothetical protein